MKGDATADVYDSTIPIWNFNASNITMGSHNLFNSMYNSVNQINLDSLLPYNLVNMNTYARLMDTLQTNNYWQCQDTPTTSNYNSDHSSSNTYDSSDWWTTCYSTYACLNWDAFPTMNVTLQDDSVLMLTTYSFLNPLVNNNSPYN